MGPKYSPDLRFNLMLPALQHWHQGVFFLFLAAAAFPAHASHHYTDQQLDALAIRVGKIYWIVAVNNQTPAFLSGPATNAASSHPQANESFEITELVGRKRQNPYYKGSLVPAEALHPPEAFLEEFKLTIAVDPQAIEKKRAPRPPRKKRREWHGSKPSRGREPLKRPR
jgi:hypothetical protein